MRCVMARVLPVPAPARMHTVPAGAVTAARCSASSPASTASGESPTTVGILPVPSDVLSIAFCLPSGGSTVLTMYSTSWCGYCHRLKSQLTREGIAYEVIDIERDDAAAEYVMSVNGGN